jgi:hypothetical protein
MNKFTLALWQIIHFIITGFFIVVAIAFIWNELTARFDNSSVVVLAFIFFFFVWVTCGVMLVPRGNSRISREFLMSCALMLLPIAALISVISAIFLPIPQHWLNEVVGIVAGIGFATLWLGIISGIITGLFFMLPNNERLTREVAGGTGMIVGGTLFMATALTWHPPIAYLAIAGIIIIFFAVIGRDKTIEAIEHKQKLWLMAFFSLLFCALIAYGGQYMTHIYWQKVLPDWSWHGQISTNNGRLNIFKKESVINKDLPEILIARNGIAFEQYPKDSEKYVTASLPIALQVDSQNIKILVIDSPFSFLSQSFQALPFVDEVIFLSPSSNLNSFAITSGYFGIINNKYSMVASAPDDYLIRSKQKFDIIIAPQPMITGVLLTEQFCSLLREHLSDNGVVALPANISRKSRQDMAKYFKTSIVVPGCSVLEVFGNYNLTSDINELERRLVRMSPQPNQIPNGILAALYSFTDDTNIIDNSSVNDEIFTEVTSVKLLLPQLALVLLLLFIILIFAIVRFLLTRIGNYSIGFGAFENGFFTSGVVVLLLITSNQINGNIATSMPLLLGIIGCFFLGKICCYVPCCKMLFATLSCLFPIVIFCDNYDSFKYLLPISIIVTALSAGLVEEILTRRVTLMPKEILPVWRCVGCASGVLFFSLIMITVGGLISFVVILLLFRFPLMFSVMPFDDYRRY